MTRSDTRAPGRALRTALAAALALLALGCAGSGGGSGSAAGPEPGLSAAEVERATALFESESCSTCHGPDAEGSDLAPALRSLAGYWDEARIVRYLEDPEAFRAAEPEFDRRRDTEYDLDMPAFGHIPLEDRTTLARWLLTR